MEIFDTLALLQRGDYGYWPWWAAGGFLFAIIGWFVGATRGHGCIGFLLGLVLGPLGLIITLFLPRK
jgi:hypothetical protein